MLGGAENVACSGYGGAHLGTVVHNVWPARHQVRCVPLGFGLPVVVGFGRPVLGFGAGWVPGLVPGCVAVAGCGVVRAGPGGPADPVPGEIRNRMPPIAQLAISVASRPTTTIGPPDGATRVP